MGQSILQRPENTRVENPEKLLVYLQGSKVKLWYMECIRYNSAVDEYYSGVYTYYMIQEKVKAYLSGELDRFNFKFLPPW